MTLQRRIELMEIDELLTRFEWLTDVDYIEVDILSDPDIGTFMLEAEYDDDGEFCDLVYTRCSYRTTLRNEPSFWAWESLRAGDYVATIC